jgi:hypothetical protein
MADTNQPVNVLPMSVPPESKEEIAKIRWMQSKEKYTADKIEQLGVKALDMLNEQLPKLQKLLTREDLPEAEQDLEWLLLGTLKPIFIGCGGSLSAMLDKGNVVCVLDLVVWYDSTRNEGCQYFRTMPVLLSPSGEINPEFIEAFKSAFRGYYMECDRRFK